MRQLLVNRRPLLPQLGHWAKRTPTLPGLLTAASAVASDAELAQARDHFLFVEVVEDYEAPAVEAQITDLCRNWDISGLISTAEIDVLRCARIRQRLGLAGQGVASAEAYRNKFVMKRHAARAGVAVADMALLADADGLREFLARTAFPVLLKPLRGAASIGIVRVEQAAGFASAARSLPAGIEYMVESFIDGEMYHVDGLMRQGKVMQAWPSRYLYTQWETMYESRPNLSAMLSPSDPRTPLLRDAAVQVVAGLQAAPELLPFHAEFFLDRERRPVLCEVACRAGGAGITEAYERSFGLGMNEASVVSRLGEEVVLGHEPPESRHGWAWFPPQAGQLKARPQTCDLPNAKRYLPKAKIGQRFAGPSAVTHAVAELIFAVDEGDVEEQLRNVDDWWAGQCKYV